MRGAEKLLPERENKVQMYKKTGFDRGPVPRYPDMACIGRVTGIGEPVSYDNDVTTTFPVLIETAGSVPTVPRASIRLAAAFLNPDFKRAELAGLKAGKASMLWIFSDNISAPKNKEKETEDGDLEYERDEAGDYVQDRSIPHLLGLCGVDYKKYGKISEELQALWPDKATSRAEIKAILERHLTGCEVGFWLMQKQEKVGETLNDAGETVGVWESTNLFNIKAPKFEDAAYFRPDAKGRAWILSRVRSEKNVNKKTGQPYKTATFDEATVF